MTKRPLWRGAAPVTKFKANGDSSTPPIPGQQAPIPAAAPAAGRMTAGRR
jgi:hypothetical protein